MKANIAKKVLICTLSASLMLAPVMGVSAKTSSAGSEKSVKEKVEAIITENTAGASTEGTDAGTTTITEVPTTSAVAGVKTSVAGVYLATNVNGVAITTGLSTIADGYGLADGEKPYARVYNLDAKKSYLAQACIDNAAASMGATVGPAINAEIGKMASGKFSLLPADGAPITLKVGVPKSFAQDGKTFAVVAVRPGGVVSILTDTDENPNTVTFNTTAGQAAYALIKY